MVAEFESNTEAATPLVTQSAGNKEKILHYI